MPDFSKRSQEKELLDRDDIPFKDIEKNMQELDVINSRLGGHKATIEGVSKIIHAFKCHENEDGVIVCEVGCGGGDNLKAIVRWAEKRSINIKCIGVDINPDCIAYAIKNNPYSNISYFCCDYRKANIISEQPHIIFSSLFCHHFTEEELIKMVGWMTTVSPCGWVINDLHRHPLAYYEIKLLTSLFSKSYLVKNDAPISVLRGFKRNELKDILVKNGIKEYNYTIRWRWPFRWLVVLSKDYKRMMQESETVQKHLPQ